MTAGAAAHGAIAELQSAYHVLSTATAALQRDSMDMRDRLTRLETKQEAIVAGTARGEADIASLEVKVDDMRRAHALGVGALRVGLWVGHAVAALAGFAAAHFWPAR
jgi:hypothetical protein